MIPHSLTLSSTLITRALAAQAFDPRVRLPDGDRRGLPRGHRGKRVAGLAGGGHDHADHRGGSHVPVVDSVQVLPAQGSQVRRTGREVSSDG